VFFTPPPMPSASTTDTAADLAVAARLFGGTLGGTSSSIASGSGLRLKGVVAPTPGTAASAIFNTGAGRDLSVYIGNEIQPGVKLVEVLPDAVVVSRAGVRERIDLDARRSLAAAGAGRAVPVQGFRINVARPSSNSFALSRKELDDALKDPNQLNFLGRIGSGPQGGVRMEAAPGGSLAAKLGLQPGDVIQKINGKTVSSPGDLALLYQQFGTLSMVQAEVQRGNTTVNLSYAIQP
jgi:general secretion pathway protein C